MAKTEAADIPEVFALYLVNVSQPVSEGDVAGNLQKAPRFCNWRRERLLRRLRRALRELLKQRYIRQSADGRYFATYLGIRLLSEKRMAFPRDKHRSYFLKEALRRRG